MSKDMHDEDVKVGDVVQIQPGAYQSEWDGCFAVVTEARSWGVVADVYGFKDTYPIRLASNQFGRIGKATFRREE
jgi:hypothetical protein